MYLYFIYKLAMNFFYHEGHEGFTSHFFTTKSTKAFLCVLGVLSGSILF